MIYPDNKHTTLGQYLALPLMALFAAGCNINPNFQTIFTPDASTYQIEGALTRGNASRPKLAYVEAEGDNPDIGSFRKDGDPNAGIDAKGIYIPSATIPVDASGRFKITFTGSSRYVLIRVFAWDDVNDNGIRDVSETLGGDFQLNKNDLTGWKFNAADWNQFNFAFQ